MTQRITLTTACKPQELEYAWFAPENRSPDRLEKADADSAAAPLVFLHEGLGSVALWRDFPQKLCNRLQRRGIAYSRYGYGASTPRPLDEPFPPDYLEREAGETLPCLLDALAIKRPWLIGHSDGGSIALLAAARKTVPLAGIVVIAPHYFVEEVCLAGIARARLAYEEKEGKLRASLSRYHNDPDSAFYGWHDAWVNPERRGWSIAAELANIACPTLALQGREDEYATLEQIEGVQRHAPHTALCVMESCGHFPHLTQSAATLERIAAFIEANPA